MKELICEACSSHEFTKAGKYLICDYCQSRYLAKDFSLVPAVEKTPLVYKKPRNRRGLWIALIVAGALLLTVGGTIIAARASLHTSPTGLSQKEKADNAWALANISLVPGWSEKTYQSIELATTNYDDKTNKTSYSGGTKFSDLVKIVGQPTKVSDALDKSLKLKYAEFNYQDKSGKNYISITIDYDEQTNLIWQKGVYGNRQ